MIGASNFVMLVLFTESRLVLVLIISMLEKTKLLLQTTAPTFPCVATHPESALD